MYIWYIYLSNFWFRKWFKHEQGKTNQKWRKDKPHIVYWVEMRIWNQRCNNHARDAVNAANWKLWPTMEPRRTGGNFWPVSHVGEGITTWRTRPRNWRYQAEEKTQTRPDNAQGDQELHQIYESINIELIETWLRNEGGNKDIEPKVIKLDCI